jgi:PqqD family protein of HPr-rel-A system
LTALGNQGPGWHLRAGQRLVLEEFDDGIVMFDTGAGATHLLNLTAAETLAIVQESPGLTTSALYERLLLRLEIGRDALPESALKELMRRLDDLQLVCARNA